MSSTGALNFITFNQDHSCLAVGTSNGFRIYHTDRFTRIFNSDEGNVSIIEMLFSTSLVALILSPRHLIIQNTKRASVICELTFPSAVLAVRLNRKRLAVILEEEIYLYDISNMSLLHTIATSPNPSAICALSPSSENCYIAYPYPKARDDQNERRPAHAPPLSAYVPPTSGELLVYDTINLKAVNVIEAHRSPLSFVAMNSTGTLVATTSETGTIIRVFALPGGQKLHQFRRGTIPSTIHSMSFNLSSTLLCLSSASDTIHIFRLTNPQQAAAAAAAAGGESSALAALESASIPRTDRTSRSRSFDSGGESPNSNAGSPRSEATDYTGVSRPTAGGSAAGNRRQSGTFGSMLRRSSQIMGRGVVGVVGSYLPQSVTEMWDPERDFASVKIPRPAGTASNRSSGLGAPGPLRSVVAMSSSSPQVMVVTSDGGYYVFNIDLENGGEGYLVNQFSILGDDKLDASGFGA